MGSRILDIREVGATKSGFTHNEIKVFFSNNNNFLII